MDFDKAFIFKCLKNDLNPTKDKIKVLDSIDIDFEKEEITGTLKVDNLTKKDLKTTICDYLKSKEFDFLVRYGLLSYDCYIKSENNFSLEIGPDKQTLLEDVTIEELISDELNFYFYDTLLKTKDKISSFSDFKSIIDALFSISSLPKGKNKRYSFFVSGLDINKDNMMKLKDRRDPVSGIENITFADCAQVDKDFIGKYFDRSTIISYK